MTKQARGVGLLTMLITGLLIAALLFIGFLQFQNWQEQEAALAAEEVALLQAEQRLQSLMKLSELEEAMLADLEVLEQLLPQAILDEKTLVDMQAGADLSDLSFVLIRFSDRVRKDDYGTAPIFMTFEGSYHGLLNLLEYIDAYELAMRIDELRIGPGRDADEPGLIQANIRASLFYE